MELALRGRVQMNRCRPVRHRSQWRRADQLTILRIVLGVVVLGLSLAVLKQSWIGYLWPDSFALLVFLSTYALGRKVAVIDPTPTGDVLLDEALRELGRSGVGEKMWRALVGASPPKESWAILTGLLEAQGVLSASAVGHETPLVSAEESGALISDFGGLKPASRNQTVTGLRVNTQSEAWLALEERLQGVLSGQQMPDAQMVALLLLATLGDLRGGTRLPRKDAILYQLCPPETRAAAHARLSAILKGDPALALHIGECLYDTLLGIRDRALESRRRP